MIRKTAYRLLSFFKNAGWEYAGKPKLLIETNESYSARKWDGLLSGKKLNETFEIKYFNDKYTGYKLVNGADAVFMFGINTAFDVSGVRFYYSGISGVPDVSLPAGKYLSSKGITSGSIALYCFNAALFLTGGEDRPVFDFTERCWMQSIKPVESLELLKTKKIGILGLGRNGSAIAKALREHGCPVAGYDTDSRTSANVETFCSSMEELIRRSDILVISVLANDSSDELITGKEISLMPQGASVINISRGSVLSESALVESLKNGKLSGAVLDVRKGEERGSRSNSKGIPNLLVTPHVAGNINDFTDEIMNDFCEKLEKEFRTND